MHNSCVVFFKLYQTSDIRHTLCSSRPRSQPDTWTCSCTAWVSGPSCSSVSSWWPRSQRDQAYQPVGYETLSWSGFQCLTRPCRHCSRWLVCTVLWRCPSCPPRHCSGPSWRSPASHHHHHYHHHHHHHHYLVSQHVLRLIEQVQQHLRVCNRPSSKRN